MTVKKAAEPAITPELPKAPTSVKYLGTSNARMIREAEFTKAGVADQGTIIWDKRNNYLVKAQHLNADALELLGQFKEFRVNQ